MGPDREADEPRPRDNGTRASVFVSAVYTRANRTFLSEQLSRAYRLAAKLLEFDKEACAGCIDHRVASRSARLGILLDVTGF